MLRKIIYAVIAVAFFLLLGKGFLLFSDEVFGFHDITQAGRVYDFALNIRSLQIPPRIAPTFSHGMGYQIFNHYAPFAYWVTALPHLLGLSIPLALKLSFFSAVLVAAGGMYLYLREQFSEQAAVLGGVLYASSPYIALEIFVRGNLAEVWFLALLPVVLYLLHKVHTNNAHGWLVALSIVFAFFLTSHNALSITGGIIVGFYALMFHNRRLMSALVIGGLLSASFLLPAVLELSTTHATSVATQTNYAEHFVCPRQFWDSPIGYGGSTPGCTDGMSFQLGKILIAIGLIGLLGFATKHIQHFIKHKSIHFEYSHSIFIAFILLISLFLTLDRSLIVWISLGSFLELFQFPWRFLGLAIFSGAYFGAYTVEMIPSKYRLYITGVVSLAAIFLSAQFFVPNPDKVWSSEDFNATYLSESYIRNEVAYRVPEYLPKTADFEVWMGLQGAPELVPNEDLIIQDGELYTELSSNPFGFKAATSSQSFLINKHYARYWKIQLNEVDFIPTTFDPLGRPVITTDKPKTIVEVIYKQTVLQHIANTISLGALIILAIAGIRSWRKKL